ncbi:hypothetical protein [Streptomyces pilosus]|nr:hypothetical protein [Streptomyces pilosus]
MRATPRRRGGAAAGGRELAEFGDAWQELLDVVTKSLDSKGVDTE